MALWLVRNRRYLGVASFGYALLHTLFYLLDAGSATTVLAQLPSKAGRLERLGFIADHGPSRAYFQ